MIALIKKDLFQATITGLILVPVLSIYWLWSDAVLDPTIVILMSALIHVIPLTALLKIEQEEDKYHGYEFLRALPLSIREIVRAKFLLTGANVLGLTIYGFLFLIVMDEPPVWFDEGCNFLITSACTSLALLGLIHVGICQFGFTPFIRYLMAALLTLGILPQIIFFNLSSQWNAPGPMDLVILLGSFDPWIAGTLGLALYALLMVSTTAVRTRANSS
ncbi:MAG: hypothetical protein HOH43_04175 [Candidatus Latescibacteria bacterium]|jgi:predicted permease|nr:hypothetical protein [Candidatus Latescibacterota bacterium]